MRKKVFYTISFIIIIFTLYDFCHMVSFAYYDMGQESKKANVRFAESALPNAFMVNNTYMVPAKLFLETIGANTKWLNKREELISYKNNTFLKLIKDQQIAHVNGNLLQMPAPSFIYKGEMVAPLSFLITLFDIKYEQAGYRNDVHLDFRLFENEYMKFGLINYRKFTFPGLGVSIFLPDTSITQNIGDDNHPMIEATNPYDDSIITIEAYDISPNESLKNVAKEYGKSLFLQNLDILAIDSQKNSNHSYELIQFSNQEKIKGFAYVFREQNKAYVIKGHHMTDVTLSQIVSTFSVDRISVEKLAEHYVELDLFFDYDMTFDQPIYSNMLVGNSFYISGKIHAEPTNAQALRFVVTKNNSTAEFLLPIENNIFRGRIYIPFGLGKHNIEVYLANDFSAFTLETLKTKTPYLDSDKLLMFSVLSEETASTSFLIPTQGINYDANVTYQLLNDITKNHFNQFDRAKSIYQWVLKHYDVDDTSTTDTPIETFFALIAHSHQEKISAIELCIIYTGLLRASNIPAKIAYNDQEIWVESYINGKWYYNGIIEDDFSNNSISNYLIPLDPIMMKNIFML